MLESVSTGKMRCLNATLYLFVDDEVSVFCGSIDLATTPMGLMITS